MAIELKTSRGVYRLMHAKDPQILADAHLLTLAMERADGIEKVALQCRIARELIPSADGEATMHKLAGWIERDFEMIRESALKSIRGERKLLELTFDADHRGPF